MWILIWFKANAGANSEFLRKVEGGAQHGCGTRGNVPIVGRQTSRIGAEGLRVKELGGAHLEG